MRDVAVRRIDTHCASGREENRYEDEEDIGEAHSRRRLHLGWAITVDSKVFLTGLPFRSIGTKSTLESIDLFALCFRTSKGQVMVWESEASCQTSSARASAEIQAINSQAFSS